MNEHKPTAAGGRRTTLGGAMRLIAQSPSGPRRVRARSRINEHEPTAAGGRRTTLGGAMRLIAESARLVVVAVARALAEVVQQRQ